MSTAFSPCEVAYSDEILLELLQMLSCLKDFESGYIFGYRQLRCNHSLPAEVAPSAVVHQKEKKFFASDIELPQAWGSQSLPVKNAAIPFKKLFDEWISAHQAVTMSK